MEAFRNLAVKDKPFSHKSTDRLMLYPEEARDYVVVHELAHLCEMNHSKRFYSIIEKILPDYKQRRKLLK